MAAGIVIELEIIQIDHGDATLLDRSLDLVLVITAVISSRQRIDIELVVIAGKTVQKFLPAFRIDQKLSIHTAHQLHHTGLSIYFHKTGCHLKQFISFILQLGPLFPVLIDLSGNTVFTGFVLLPMFHFTGLVFSALIASRQPEVSCIQETYNRKDFPVQLHPLLCLLPRHFIR